MKNWSRGMTWNGRFLERAALSAPASPDDVIRSRAAGAPLHVKRAMDRRREARGMRPLWRAAVAGVDAPATPPASRVPSKPPARKAAPTDGYVLAGAVAPGTSAPVKVGTEGLVMHERIKPRAFDASLAAIAAGTKVVELQDGHDGNVIATTADGSLTFEVMPLVGVVATAHVRARRCGLKLLGSTFANRVGLSVAFRPLKASYTKDARGRDVRIIHDAELDHVAVCRPGVTPVYPTRVVAVAATKQNAARLAVRRATLTAAEMVVKQLRRGT